MQGPYSAGPKAGLLDMQGVLQHNAAEERIFSKEKHGHEGYGWSSMAAGAHQTLKRDNKNVLVTVNALVWELQYARSMMLGQLKVQGICHHSEFGLHLADSTNLPEFVLRRAQVLWKLHLNDNGQAFHDVGRIRLQDFGEAASR